MKHTNNKVARRRSMSEGDVAAIKSEGSPLITTAATETGEGTDSSLLELTAGLERGEKGEKLPAATDTVPPPASQSGVSILAHKIWIGNLDKRLSQEIVLKFVRRYGTPVSFRFNFKAGTDVMEPRGYCFVEYSTREEAEKAKAALDGKKALGKKIVVDWARIDPASKKNEDGVSETWDPSVVSETLDKGVSTSAKIAALEAKLRAMEEGKTSNSVVKQRPWSSERQGRRRPPDSRVISRPHTRGRTRHFRARRPFT